MSKETDSFKDLLLKFGLEQIETDIFEYLLVKGSSSVSNLSKGLAIPRTSIYRAIEHLSVTQLVREIITSKGKAYEAGSIKELELILAQREEELKDLKASIRELTAISKKIQTPSIAQTKVVSYKGIEGLKQITWNSTKAVKELRIMELSTMSAFLDYGFSERARTEFLLNKVHVKEITNLTELPKFTDIKQFVSECWECRNVPKEMFEIKFEILIYNDVYVMYSYLENDIVGVEIYNEKLAEMQKEIFDFIWSHGNIMKKLDENGACKLL